LTSWIILSSEIHLTRLSQIRGPALILRRGWDEQYVDEAGQLRWRAAKAMPSPAGLIASPYDPAAQHEA
jgi:hypothetical protein